MLDLPADGPIGNNLQKRMSECLSLPFDYWPLPSWADLPWYFLRCTDWRKSKHSRKETGDCQHATRLRPLHTIQPQASAAYPDVRPLLSWLPKNLPLLPPTDPEAWGKCCHPPTGQTVYFLGGTSAFCSRRRDRQVLSAINQIGNLHTLLWAIHCEFWRPFPVWICWKFWIHSETESILQMKPSFLLEESLTSKL